jgi:flagellar biogenesis protein FliO
MFQFVLTVLPAAEATPLGGTTGPDMTRYLVVCGGLLVLVLLLGVGFRKLISKTMQVRAAQRSMQVMDMLPLGNKQRLCVVRCYDRTFLLGLGDKEMTSIAELDPVIAPAREAAPNRADLHTFSRMLERLRGKSATNAPEATLPEREPTRSLRPTPRPAVQPAAQPIANAKPAAAQPLSRDQLSKEGVLG